MGCAFEIIALQQLTVQAAAIQDPAGRRATAERGFALYQALSKDKSDQQGDLVFSAIRFDACQTLGDEACAGESATLVKRAADLHGDHLEDEFRCAVT